MAAETETEPVEEVVDTSPGEATLLPRGTASPEGFAPPDPKLWLLVSEPSPTPDSLLPASRAYRATLVLLIVQQFFVFLVLLTFSFGALRTSNKYQHIFYLFHGTNILVSISLFWLFSMLLLSIF
jgi:hypothetical protein